MGAKATFDHVTRTIKLTEAPTLINGELTVEIDVKIDLYSDQKEDWLSTPALRTVRPPIFPEGGIPTPTGYLGSTFFIASDWKIEPYSADHRLVVSGNIYSVDGTSPYIKASGGPWSLFLESTVSNLIDGLATSDDFAGAVWDTPRAGYVTHDKMGDMINHIPYQHKVIYIDTEAILAGDGSQHTPFNDLTTAIDFAEFHNIRDLFVFADIVIDRTLKNFVITGIGIPTIDCNGQNLNKSEFTHCRMEGSYTGEITVQQCALLNNFYLNGFFENCGFGGDLFCIANANILLKDCASLIPGIGSPSVSMNSGQPSYVSIQGYNGSLVVKNCDHANDALIVEMASGELEFDPSCTAGIMVARGVCKFIDNSLGATVTDNTLSTYTISNAVFDKEVEVGHSLKESLRLILSSSSAKVSGAEGTVMTFRDINDVLDRIVAVVDEHGNRTSVVTDVS